ncbi:AaceriACR020Cp [[Ashbya] aceris (nom. inval.)]|nr:AaceriACR020Cp [[Ashbya] aceris (nom. inval.)]
MSRQVNRDLFYKLTSDLSDERVQSAIALITELNELAVEENAKEWEYVLGRLVRGLASSNKSARLGFSLCLTEVAAAALEKGLIGSANEYLERLEGALPVDKVKNGKEERGQLFGRMFGLQAMLNEPLFSRVFVTADGQIQQDFALLFMQRLVQLALMKAWLRQPCLFTLYQVIERLAPRATDAEFLRAVLTLLDEHSLTHTSEGLAVYLFLQNQCPETKRLLEETKIFDSLALVKRWKGDNPLAKGNAKALASVLKDDALTEGDGSKQKGVWTPRLHFVWDLLLPLLVTEKALPDSHAHVSKKRKTGKKTKSVESGMLSFAEFWQVVVDESFFSEKASSERKYLGILIMEKAVNCVPSSVVQEIFSKNALRTLINQSSETTRHLHKLSVNFLKTVVTVCEMDAAKLVPVLSAIWFGPNGTINFDKLTKSKTADSLVTAKSLTATELAHFVILLLQQLEDEDTDMPKIKFILDTLLHIVRAHKWKAHSSWTNPLLLALVRYSFFSAPNHLAQKSEEITTLSRERLFSVLGELIPLSKHDMDAPSWAYAALELLLEEKEKQPLAVQLDAELETVTSHALEILQKIIQKSAKAPNENPQLFGLELLLAVSILQVHAGDVDSASTLEELTSFYESAAQGADNGLVGITEILLSLVAQKKSMLRKLTLVVWESFIDKVGRDELDLLLNTLSARENKAGFAQLFEGADEYEELSSDEAGTDNENHSSQSGQESSDESSEQEENYSDEDVAKIDKEATSALAHALRLPDNIVDEDGNVGFEEMDDEEEEEESMDDEAMMQLDGQLSEIFKRRKDALNKIPTGNQRKIEAKESRDSVIAFKHRVVDMLEIYCRNVERSVNKNKKLSVTMSANMLSMTEPMVKAIQQTVDRPLAEKISKLLKNNICKMKPAAYKDFSNEISKESVLSSLESVHSAILSPKPGQFPQIFFSACSSTSLFLSKVLIAMKDDPSTSEQLIDMYSTTMKHWNASGKFGPNFFIDFINWLASKKSKN